MSFEVVKIDGSDIQVWESFHDKFAETFGFPDFYGRNMNAWIDCMSSLDAPDDGLSQVHVSKNGVVVISLGNAAKLKAANPEIWDALNECTAFVNHRRIEIGDAPVLTLSYHA